MHIRRTYACTWSGADLEAGVAAPLHWEHVQHAAADLVRHGVHKGVQTRLQRLRGLPKVLDVRALVTHATHEQHDVPRRRLRQRRQRGAAVRVAPGEQRAAVGGRDHALHATAEASSILFSEMCVLKEGMDCAA